MQKCVFTRLEILKKYLQQCLSIFNFYSHYQPKPKSVTGDPEGDGIWQDDGARIHRCPQALRAVFDSFNDRVDYEAQAPKMADTIWPVENLWSIIKADVAKDQVNNMQDLKKSIKKFWRKVHQIKELCRRLMNLFLSGYLLSSQMMANKVHKYGH